ncbi:4'-phosphopantetheinyl transferase superfamily protein [Deinococcus sp. Arct2-2]|uniref:4'-phosphopantetheinyl transferase family protein n=1 Tax=Deinococcus sp. Arct2-2 TaxID=2568653 RepID=UPI0010A3A607|nr:4'-phosphopantetheinyl transferase superfamily protein [Deinococcus sp. Arct2-2]THF70282.1 4'-phosphopantetheinyl transferase superfamily protein [Deinococcus sp. Arct2-2]
MSGTTRNSDGPTGTLWLMHLPAAEAGAWQTHACLNAVELARAEAFASVAARGFYVASVVFRRTILGEVLHLPPAEVQFEFPAGRTKPHLAPSQNPTDWRFNLSHSGEYAVLALVQGRDAGVDIERMRGAVNWRGVAQTAFSQFEQTALFAERPEHTLDTFYRLWTAKEAYLKACGAGLSVPLEAVSVALAGADIDVAQAVPGDLQHWRGQVVPLPAALAPVYRAAVVVQAAPTERLSLSVQHWTLPMPSADI